jgi:hypothetical protein
MVRVGAWMGRDGGRWACVPALVAPGALSAVCRGFAQPSGFFSFEPRAAWLLTAPDRGATADRSSGFTDTTGVTLRVLGTVWQFLVGLIVGIGLGILIMAALVASSRKP